MIPRITVMCVAVAMVCAMLRPQRPELATAISLAGGLAALAMLSAQAGALRGWVDALSSNLGDDGDVALVVLKGAGITLLSELGAQICADAGESALAGRIALAARVAMLGLCAPLFSELAGLIGGALWQGG